MSHVPSDPHLAVVYWMFVCGTVGIAALVHVAECFIHHQRISAASKSLVDPARPRNIVSRSYATITALTREFAGYAHPILPSSLCKRFPRLASLPVFGRIALMGSNFALLLVLVFLRYDGIARNYEKIAVRAGWLSVAQIPLVFLLAGKCNIVGALTGTSHERLNWVHRWVARCLFITVMIHLSYFLRSWARYDFIGTKFKTDVVTQRGMTAGAVLIWITISSIAPIRGWRYEIFIVQHTISFVAFVYLAMVHLPKNEARVYLWVPAGLYILDRVLRSGFMLYNNLAIFHSSSRQSNPSSLLTCQAKFHSLPDRAVKVTISNPPFSWKPGQHVFLACHSLALLQSHPFTIASLPSDDSLEFIIGAKKGATKHFHAYTNSLLPPNSDIRKAVILDGPYGRMRELDQFDSVTLLAGSTGATFIIPLLRDILRLKAAGKGVVTRKIRFVWVVKRRENVEWFAKELTEAVYSIDGLQNIELEISIYVTCDESLSSMENSANPEAPRIDSVQDTKVTTVTEKEINNGGEDVITEEKGRCAGDQCCCQDTIKDEDAIVEAGSTPKVCCCNIPEENDLQEQQQTKSGNPETLVTTVQSTPTSSSSPSIKSTLGLPKNINIFAGRPEVQRLIEKELEKAMGESAVVVCGPTGLVDSVRQAVVWLSNERAVHKGTGAQGIYLHTETFGW